MFFNIRMSIIPSPSSRQMKINAFSVHYSNEIFTKMGWNYWSIFKSVQGLGLLVACDMNGYSIAMLVYFMLLLVWFKYAHVHCICPCQTLTLKPSMSI